MGGPTKHPKTSRPCADCGTPFLGTAPARWCPACRWKHRGRKAKKYVWTPERDQLLRERYDGKVHGRAAEISTALGWPDWVIKKHAQTLGLSYPWSPARREWTQQEERFLTQHAGSRHVHWMAKQLNRSETSVVLKLKRRGLSRRWREGYTLGDLEQCFGCDHHGIDRWIREGQLVGRRRGTRRIGPGGQGNDPADAWYFKDEDLLRFVRSYPQAFRLDKVDQVWFLDLVLGPAVARRATA
jgi:guanyl-specific ribonuclease Sa